MKVTLQDIVGPNGIFTDGDWVESKDQDPNGNVRLIQLADVGDGSFVNKSSRYMSSMKATQLRCTYLEPGHILIARMPDPIGRACIFPGLKQSSVTVVDICVLRPDRKRVCSRWLLHKINGEEFRRAILSSVTGTTRQRISRGNLSKIGFVLPPLDVQRRIAAILDKADALRRKRKQALKLFEKFTNSLIAELLDTPQHIELGEIIEDGPTNGLYKPSRDYGEGVPILRINSFYDGKIVDLLSLRRLSVTGSELSRFKLTNDDIVINRVNSLEYLGKSAIVRGLLEPTVYESNMMRFSLKKSIMLPDVCIALLQTPEIKSQILAKAKNAVNQSSINQRDVCSPRLVLPAMETQRKFVAKVQKVAALIAPAGVSRFSLDTLFSSLQSRAFSGQL